MNLVLIMATPGHGGARIGAGRKPRDLGVWMTARGISPLTASEILHNSDERAKWHRVLNSQDDRVVLQALMYLMSMRDGKPAQNINVTSKSVNISATSIQQARQIIAEIRGDVGPSLGKSTSPLEADVPDSKEVSRGSLMLAAGEGGLKEGDGGG